MVTVDASVDLAEITISGRDVSKILSGGASTGLAIILGFRQTGESELKSNSITNSPKQLADCVQILTNFHIPVQLTQTAANAVKGHVAYLRSYNDAVNRGLEIQHDLPAGLPLPPSFRRELKPFQLVPARHLTEIPYAANFSVPGSGKTTLVLAAYAILKSSAVVDKLLVICPRAAFDPWVEEFQGCFGRRPRAARMLGTSDARDDLFDRADNYELFLASYQMMANERDQFASLLRSFPVLMVLDESHHIKRGIGGTWYDAAISLSSLARRRIVLSGTPAPNSIVDIVPQFEFLWPGLNPLTPDVARSVDASRFSEIRRTLKPLYTRIRESDLDLPGRTEQRQPVPMGPVQARIYQALAFRLVSEAIKKLRARAFVRELKRALMVRLMQAASNPTLLSEYSEEFRVPPLSHAGVDVDELIQHYSEYEAPRKITAAAGLAKSLVKKNRKVVVWTSFILNAELLGKTLSEAGVETVVVTGLLPQGEREEETREKLLRNFKTDDSVKVLVATLPSVGESISLHQVCHDAIYLDRTFNCGLYMQSRDRIHRIGLPPMATTTYRILVSKGTIDEVIDLRLNSKMEVMYKLLNDDIGPLDLEVTDELEGADWDEEDFREVLHQISGLASKSKASP